MINLFKPLATAACLSCSWTSTTSAKSYSTFSEKKNMYKQLMLQQHLSSIANTNTHMRQWVAWINSAKGFYNNLTGSPISAIPLHLKHIQKKALKMSLAPYHSIHLIFSWPISFMTKTVLETVFFLLHLLTSIYNCFLKTAAKLWFFQSELL